MTTSEKKSALLQTSRNLGVPRAQESSGVNLMQTPISKELSITENLRISEKSAKTGPSYGREIYSSPTLKKKDPVQNTER